MEHSQQLPAKLAAALRRLVSGVNDLERLWLEAVIVPMRFLHGDDLPADLEGTFGSVSVEVISAKQIAAFLLGDPSSLEETLPRLERCLQRVSEQQRWWETLVANAQAVTPEGDINPLEPELSQLLRDSGLSEWHTTFIRDAVDPARDQVAIEKLRSVKQLPERVEDARAQLREFTKFVLAAQAKNEFREFTSIRQVCADFDRALWEVEGDAAAGYFTDAGASVASLTKGYETWAGATFSAAFALRPAQSATEAAAARSISEQLAKFIEAVEEILQLLQKAAWRHGEADSLGADVAPKVAEWFQTWRSRFAPQTEPNTRVIGWFPDPV